MLFHTIGQGSVFLWMILAGMLIGFMYDLFRLIRCLLRAGAYLTLALDMVWGASAGVVLAAMLVIANRGELRAYVLLALLVGLALYWVAASRPAAAVASRVWSLVKKVPRFRLFDIIFK